MNMLRGAQRRLVAAQQQHDELKQIVIAEIMQELEDVLTNGATEFRGVFMRNDTQKWIARIKHRNQAFQIGAYDTTSQAAAARLMAELDVASDKVPRTISQKMIDELPQLALKKYKNQSEFDRKEASALAKFKVRIGAE
jgi:cell division protein YceG involved in septum cleavage